MYILPQLKKTETLSTGLKDPSKNWFPHQRSTKGLSCRSVILTFETGSPIILGKFFFVMTLAHSHFFQLTNIDWIQIHVRLVLWRAHYRISFQGHLNLSLKTSIHISNSNWEREKLWEKYQQLKSPIHSTVSAGKPINVYSDNEYYR